MTSQCMLLKIVSHVEEEIDDTKGVIRIVNRTRTDNTMANRKRTKKNLQNTTQKTKDRVTRTTL